MWGIEMGMALQNAFHPFPSVCAALHPYAPPALDWGMQRMARASAVDWPANHLAPNFQAVETRSQPTLKTEAARAFTPSNCACFDLQKLINKARAAIIFIYCLAPNLRPDRYAPVLQT